MRSVRRCSSSPTWSPWRASCRACCPTAPWRWSGGCAPPCAAKRASGRQRSACGTTSQRGWHVPHVRACGRAVLPRRARGVQGDPARMARAQGLLRRQVRPTHLTYPPPLHRPPQRPHGPCVLVLSPPSARCTCNGVRRSEQGFLARLVSETSEEDRLSDVEVIGNVREGKGGSKPAGGSALLAAHGMHPAHVLCCAWRAPPPAGRRVRRHRVRQHGLHGGLGVVLPVPQPRGSAQAAGGGGPSAGRQGEVARWRKGAVCLGHMPRWALSMRLAAPHATPPHAGRHARGPGAHALPQRRLHGASPLVRPLPPASLPCDKPVARTRASLAAACGGDPRERRRR